MKIFYDVDTQNDFMNENGALYVPEAESIIPNLRLLTSYALETKISLAGSVDCHFGFPDEKELQINGRPFPDHCMDGTIGQLKINETIRSDKIYRTAEDNFYVANLSYYLDKGLTKEKLLRLIDRFILKRGLKFQYFEKQSYNVFTNPLFELFLEKSKVTDAVVYGVATDYCVKAAVLGMQKRNIQCYVVEDAIKGITEETTKQALEEMAEAGAKFVTTKDVLEGKVI